RCGCPQKSAEGARGDRQDAFRDCHGHAQGGSRGNLLVVQSILILGKIHEAGLDILRARPGVSFEIMAQPAEPDILALAPTADAMHMRSTKLTAAAIDAAPKLKIVSRHGVRYANCDMA